MCPSSMEIKIEMPQGSISDSSMPRREVNVFGRSCMGGSVHVADLHNVFQVAVGFVDGVVRGWAR